MKCCEDILLKAGREFNMKIKFSGQYKSKKASVGSNLRRFSSTSRQDEEEEYERLKQWLTKRILGSDGQFGKDYTKNDLARITRDPKVRQQIMSNPHILDLVRSIWDQRIERSGRPAPPGFSKEQALFGTEVGQRLVGALIDEGIISPQESVFGQDTGRIDLDHAPQSAPDLMTQISEGNLGGAFKALLGGRNPLQQIGSMVGVGNPFQQGGAMTGGSQRYRMPEMRRPSMDLANRATSSRRPSV